MINFIDKEIISLNFCVKVNEKKFLSEFFRKNFNEFFAGANPRKKGVTQKSNAYYTLNKD